MNAILNLDLPFARMNELGTLVFQAKTIQDKIKQEKIKVINDVLK